jgi:hypothetical protein
MGIKNWTVKTKGISGGSSGMAAYGKYLEDANHKNHKGKTEAITPVHGNAMQLVMKMGGRASKRTIDAQIAGKGGRPIETLAQSFIVSLPAEMRPTPAQWKSIAIDIIKALSVKLEVNPSDLAKDIFINAHENENNPHLNLLIGKLDENCDIRKKITQKAALSTIKNAVNASVLRVLGVDHAEYVPQRSGLPNLRANEYLRLVHEEKINALEVKAEELVEEILDGQATLDHMGEAISSFKPEYMSAMEELMRPAPPRVKSKREIEADAELAYEAHRDRNQGNGYTPGR